MAKKNVNGDTRRSRSGNSPESHVPRFDDRSTVHEINNVVQGMVLHLDLLRSKIADNAPALKNLAFLEDGLNRIRNIVTKSGR